MDNKTIHVFDICGTLYKSNTTFDFLWYLFKDDTKYRIFEKIYTNVVWKAVNKVCRKIIKFDLTRWIALRFIKGYNREFLLGKARLFVSTFLEEKKNKEVVNELKMLQRLNENVFLMSATIDVVAQAVAESLSVSKFKCSCLLYENNICQGLLCLDLLGKKNVFLLPDIIVESVYTDDLTDANILELARKKNIITYKKTIVKWCKIVEDFGWNVNMINY